MAISLKKGQGVSLKKTENNLSLVTIGLGWDINEKKQGFLGKLFSKEEDYDLDKDYLDVWSSPSFLLLATTDKIIENLTHRLTPLK